MQEQIIDKYLFSDTSAHFSRTKYYHFTSYLSNERPS